MVFSPVLLLACSTIILGLSYTQPGLSLFWERLGSGINDCNRWLIQGLGQIPIVLCFWHQCNHKLRSNTNFYLQKKNPTSPSKSRKYHKIFNYHLFEICQLVDINLHFFLLKFSFLGVMGTSKVCSVGITSPLTRNLGEIIRRYATNMIRKVVFLFPLQNLEILFYYYNSYFIISLMSPILDLKTPLMTLGGLSINFLVFLSFIPYGKNQV